MAVSLGPTVEPIPGYRLLTRLGRGGFGEVWKVEAPGGLLKAIKFVYGDLGATGEGEPAEQELKSLERVKSIRHPYILSLERIEVVEGQLLIVMELADRNLWDRFKDCRNGGMPGIPRDELLRYLDEAAEALDLMNHEYQLQHLDIKPQNLFLVHNHIKIADFGLVKDFEGKRGTITGGVTPVYAAPETFEGWVSRHSDQYSLAIVFQELLTGQRPFSGTTARQLLLQHLEMAPDLTPLTEGDRRVISRALAKKPDMRYPSCTELVRELREAGQSPDCASVVPGAAKVRPAVASNGNQCLVSTPNKSHSATDKDPPPSILTQHLGSGSVHRTQVQPRDGRCGVTDDGALSLPDSAIHMGVDSESRELIPAVVVGLGGVGGKVVQRFRSAIQEFNGEIAVPQLRCLVVDTDAAAIRGLASDSEAPMEKAELFHAALKRPAHYLRSDATANLGRWLGEEALYKLPRNADSAVHRGFGRLALADHAGTLQKRLIADLEAVTAKLSTSATTGEPIRHRRPRVYVVAGLGGGTGGGSAIDFAYLARAALRSTGIKNPEVIGLFLAPASERMEAPMSVAAANTVASLTELCHFSSKATTYEPTADAKSGLGHDAAAPFSRCVVLPLGSNDSGDRKTGGALGLASGLLLRELVSPVGRIAERERQRSRPDGGLVLSTAATFRLAWPRERLKKCAALSLSQKLLRDWQTRDVPELKEPLASWLQDEWQRRGLEPDQIAERFEQATQELLGQAANEKFDAILAPLEQSARSGEKVDATAVCRVLEQLFAITGHPGGQTTAGARRELPDHLEAKTKDILRHCDVQVAEIANAIIERPRHRIGGAEEALRQVGDWAHRALGAYEPLAATLARDAVEAFRGAMALIGAVERSPAKWKDKSGQELIARVRELPRKLYQSLLADRLTSVYRGVVGSVPEYLHEVNFCRQRLQRVESELAHRQASDSDDNPAFGPGRPILTGGDVSLSAASDRIIAEMSTEDCEAFDALVQGRIADAMGTLVKFCLGSNSAVDALAELIIGAANHYMSSRLGKNSSIDRLMQSENSLAVRSLIRTAIDMSRPTWAGTGTKEELITVIGAPPTPAGEQFFMAVAEELKGTPFARAASRDEIVFCRERDRLSPGQLPYFTKLARESFKQYLSTCELSPFSRRDVTWLPVPQ